MNNPQAQGSQGPAQQQQQQQQTSFLKVEDVVKLQHLTDDQKQKYRVALTQLWTTMQKIPAGTADYNNARQKLQQWSQRLITAERQFRNSKQQQNAGQQAQQGQAPQPAQNEQAAQQQPSQAQGQSQGQTQNQQPQAPQQGQQGQNPQQINPGIIKHVQEFPYCMPLNGPQQGTPEYDQKIKEFKQTLLMALTKQEKATHRVRNINQMIEQQKNAGNEIPQNVFQQKQMAEKEFAGAKAIVEEFRKKQAQWKKEQESARQMQQQQPPSAQAQSQQPQQNMVKQEPQIKVEGGAPQQVQQPQQFGNMGVPQQQTPQSAQGGTPVNQQGLRQPPTPHSQQMPQQTQQPSFTQPGQPPQGHQPPRPQINPQQANAHAQQQSNSPHPQSATSNHAGPPVPLSHQAAVSAAQRSYSNQEPQRTQTPQQIGSAGSFHGTPGSREREQLNNPKLPIPRTLNVTQPVPVNMGQARPTMSGTNNGVPGAMNQPVLTRFPQFQLEGQGDRVLSKRKLDELVRQVTGGGEGPAGEALSPEVEEAIFQLADDFVDTVITSACKLSKLRESTQLDIRDIQLVLERNYNMRIPGYASDEIRTVRKLHPAPGWTQKMNAIQASKVMGGKTDI